MLAGWLDSLKVNKAEKRLRKNIARVTQKYGQGEYFDEALHTLIEIGTDEAYRGVMKRFTVMVDPRTRDEDEKQRAYDALVDLGEKVVPSLHKFLDDEDQIAWPMRALQDICPQPRVVEILLDVLGHIDLMDTHSTEKKIDVITQLEAVSDARLGPAFEKFLEDPTDEVKLCAVGALAQQRFEPVREKFLKIIVDPESNPRIQRAVMDALVETRWKVAGFRAKVEERIPADYYVNGEGLIRRMGA